MEVKNKIYQRTENGYVRITSERKGHFTALPNYIYDLWMPLLGAAAIGVYGTYCRLEREGSVYALPLKRISQLCRVGLNNLNTLHKHLEECGFIRLKKPDGTGRRLHHTTEIVVCDPPMHVSRAVIEKFQPTFGYSPLTPWLVDENEVLQPSGDSNRNLVKIPTGISSRHQPESPVFESSSVEKERVEESTPLLWLEIEKRAALHRSLKGGKDDVQ